MTKLIPAFKKKSTADEASGWLHRVIDVIGPCFHFDTSPEDYLQPDGMPLFSEADCARLTNSLDAALETLGRDIFEDVCLRAVRKQLEFHYESTTANLVPIDY
jgi:hypothetical protein